MIFFSMIFINFNKDLAELSYYVNGNITTVSDFSDITNNRILNWKKEILLKLNKLLHSHNLKIHLKSASHLTSEGENGEEGIHLGYFLDLMHFVFQLQREEDITAT